MPDTMIPEQSDAAPVWMPRNRSAEIAKLAAALAAAQKNFAPIPKNREVTVRSSKGDYKFKYATLDGILSATVPALAEQGLALVQTIIHDGDGNPGLETTLYHSSGEWLRNITPMFLTGRQTADGRQLPPSNQELGSAQSYARRYGISALLCVAADEDDDGNIADGNHIEGSREVPFKSRPGTAGGGTQFRPERRQMVPRNFVEAARQDGTLDETRKKGTLPGKPANGKITADERDAKLKAATDKRIALLKKPEQPWTADTLKQFWDDEAEWREWMADANNDALSHYERFTTAYTEAQDAL